MSKNQQGNAKSLTFSQKLLSMLLGAGVILAATHGAFLDAGHHQDLSPVNFTAKIMNDLHIHHDHSVVQSHVLADPRSLRNIRSDGDKTAENDPLRENWDVYTA